MLLLLLYLSVVAVIEGNEIVYRDYIDISVAVATPKVTTKSSVHVKIEPQCTCFAHV